MLWTPQEGQIRVQHNLGDVGDSTPGAQVTTGSAATTKGTAVEVFASTSFDAYWVEVVAHNYGVSAAASQGALDILTGAATEEVLIPDLLFGNAAPVSGSSAVGGKRWAFPLYIPAGSRIAVRAAGQRVSTVFSVGVVLYGGHGMPNFRVGSKVTTYGMGTLPAGTTITPGASGAAGAWTQVTASTSTDHFAFFPSWQINATVVNVRAQWVEMGLGAATEELMNIPYIYNTHTNEVMNGPLAAMPVFQDVPSGTRLVMRASNTGTNDAGYNGVIHAVS